MADEKLNTGQEENSQPSLFDAYRFGVAQASTKSELEKAGSRIFVSSWS